MSAEIFEPEEIGSGGSAVRQPLLLMHQVQASDPSESPRDDDSTDPVSENVEHAHTHQHETETVDPTPEQVARVRKMVEQDSQTLCKILGVEGVSFTLGRGWSTNMETGVVTLDALDLVQTDLPDEWNEHGVLHEVACHLRTILKEPAAAARERDFARQSEANHFFQNIITDIRGNKIVNQRLPRFQRITAELYEQYLFEDDDLTGRPRHVQLMSAMIAQEMTPGREMVVSPDVAAALAQLRQYGGKDFDMIKYVTRPTKSPTEEMTAFECMELARQFILPIYNELKEKDSEDLRRARQAQQGQEGSPQSGEGEESAPGSQGASGELSESSGNGGYSGQEFKEEYESILGKQHSHEYTEDAGSSQQQKPEGSGKATPDKTGRPGHEAISKDESGTESNGSDDNSTHTQPGAEDKTESTDPTGNDDGEEGGENGKEGATPKQSAQDKFVEKLKNLAQTHKPLTREQRQDKAMLEETGYTMEQYNEYLVRYQKLRPQIDRMRDFFRQIIDERVVKVRRLSRPTAEGSILDPNTLAQAYVDVRSGVPSPPVYQDYEWAEREREVTGRFDIFLALDASGSMHPPWSNNDEPAADSAVIIMEGLNAFMAMIQEEERTRGIKLDLDVRTAMHIFGSEQTTVKPLGHELVRKDRLKLFHESFQNQGGTSDFLALEAIAEEIDASAESKRRRVVFFIADGGSDDSKRLIEAVQALEQRGCIMVPIGLGDAAVDVSSYVIDEDEDLNEAHENDQEDASVSQNTHPIKAIFGADATVVQEVTRLPELLIEKLESEIRRGL